MFSDFIRKWERKNFGNYLKSTTFLHDTLKNFTFAAFEVSKMFGLLIQTKNWKLKNHKQFVPTFVGAFYANFENQFHRDETFPAKMSITVDSEKS